MSKNILLVDKRVEAYETIVSAVNLDVCVPVVFDCTETALTGVTVRASTNNTCAFSCSRVETLS